MTELEKETTRTLEAAKILIEGRDVDRDASHIVVTLEALVALVLLVVMNNDTRKAASMLNEGLVPAVEELLARAAARQRLQVDPRDAG